MASMPLLLPRVRQESVAPVRQRECPLDIRETPASPRQFLAGTMSEFIYRFKLFLLVRQPPVEFD
jgi:hypothetical protein